MKLGNAYAAGGTSLAPLSPAKACPIAEEGEMRLQVGDLAFLVLPNAVVALGRDACTARLQVVRLCSGRQSERAYIPSRT